jgi:hypothetical protein
MEERVKFWGTENLRADNLLKQQQYDWNEKLFGAEVAVRNATARAAIGGAQWKEALGAVATDAKSVYRYMQERVRDAKAYLLTNPAFKRPPQRRFKP